MSELFRKKGNEPGGRGGNGSGTRGCLDILPKLNKRASAKLTIDDEVTLDNLNPEMASSKRPRVMSKCNSFSKPADFMGILYIGGNTKSQRDKYEAAKLKYIVQTDPQFIREREKDRRVEIEKTQIEKLQDIEEVFTRVLALAKGKAAVVVAEPLGPLSNVLDGVLSRNGLRGIRGLGNRNRGGGTAVMLNRNAGKGSSARLFVVTKGPKPTPKLSLPSHRLQDHHMVDPDEIENEEENMEEIDNEDRYNNDEDELN
ncbi:hypothetical protein EV426DRAFT_575267 [Tirmania nivea]|nr:hypothetical protein EV426DRAFT_575267 [Tirmania nivea]